MEVVLILILIQLFSRSPTFRVEEFSAFIVLVELFRYGVIELKFTRNVRKVEILLLFFRDSHWR